jgi:hypothetical protein|tara:strand:+ start:456 stop:671 length:216 start_codon:yes stop_codon:yes gene_type:complete
MTSNELKVVVREEPQQTNLYKNKRVIEVNHAKNIVSFWETNYTFRQIIELVVSVPELRDELDKEIFKSENI